MHKCTSSSVGLFPFESVQCLEGNKTRRFEEEYSALSPNYKKSGFKDPELFLLDRFSAALKAKSLRPEDKTLLFLHSVGIDKAGHEHLPHTE